MWAWQKEQSSLAKRASVSDSATERRQKNEKRVERETFKHLKSELQRMLIATHFRITLFETKFTLCTLERMFVSFQGMLLSAHALILAELERATRCDFLEYFSTFLGF